MGKSLGLAALAAFASVASAGMQSPPFPAAAFFNRPVKIPQVAVPRFTFTNEITGRPIDYFQVDMRGFLGQQYPNLPPTPMWGYDGGFPGPTFNITQGRESFVRFVNHDDRVTTTGVHPNTSVHLHGSESRSPWDGYADGNSSLATCTIKMLIR
jgi:bilirubin oxidase